MPMGTGPRTGASCSHSTPSSVPTMSAATGPGRYVDNRRGQSAAMTSESTPIVSALKFALPSADGSLLTDSSGPPPAGAPSNGPNWITMMIMPMPDMNPEITMRGVYATKRPIRVSPSRVCSNPPSTTIVKASESVEAWLATITAVETAIGPVGPEICVRVPPKTAAKNPTAIEP